MPEDAPAEAAAPLIQGEMAVLAVLLGVLAVLFWLARHPRTAPFFRVVPLLVFCYFVPTALSNTGLIPVSDEFPLYVFVKNWLLPASLMLLILSVDLKAIARLGVPALILFFGGTAGIVFGGPIAYALLGGLVPAELGDQTWRGLAALSGSWIGGGANFIAIGESVGASESIIAAMVVVDVAVANVWMAVLLFMAQRDKRIDAAIGADRAAMDHVREKVETFQQEVSRPAKLHDLMAIAALGLGGAALAHGLADHLPSLGQIVSRFTWIVVIVTTLSLGLSFTRFRNLDGAGASSVGSVFLYLLVATIGAKANFAKVIEAPELVLIGALWMCFHAAIILLLWRLLKTPIFFGAVGSQANVGGAASAPIVAAAFHPALAPVGVLLGVLGYAVGTYAGLLCAWLLELVYSGLYAPTA